MKLRKILFWCVFPIVVLLFLIIMPLIVVGVAVMRCTEYTMCVLHKFENWALKD